MVFSINNDLVVVHLYGQISQSRDNPEEITFKGWKARSSILLPLSTCMRQVFITSRKSMNEMAFPGNVEAEKKELLSGEEAYRFLLEWASGIYNRKGDQKKPDTRVIRDIKKEWECIRKSSETYKSMLGVMQMLFEDVSKISRIWSDPTISQERSKDDLLEATYAATRNCAYSRAGGRVPSYAFMQKQDISTYKSLTNSEYCQKELAKHRVNCLSDTAPDGVLAPSSFIGADKGNKTKWVYMLERAIEASFAQGKGSG